MQAFVGELAGFINYDIGHIVEPEGSRVHAAAAGAGQGAHQGLTGNPASSRGRRSLEAAKLKRWIDAEVERLRAQHGVLHDYMNDISNALDAYSKNIDSEVRRLHRNLSEYIDVCRRHVHAENKIFYPLVLRTLTEDEKNWLNGEFDKHAAKEGPDPMKAYGVFIQEMAKLL